MTNHHVVLIKNNTEKLTLLMFGLGTIINTAGIIAGGLAGLLFASFLKPIMTDLAMNYLSMVGSVLIFCVGINLAFNKKIRVANMLPSLVLAVIAAFCPLVNNFYCHMRRSWHL